LTGLQYSKKSKQRAPDPEHKDMLAHGVTARQAQQLYGPALGYVSQPATYTSAHSVLGNAT